MRTINEQSDAKGARPSGVALSEREMEDYEIPPCTLTGEVDYVDFPVGALHLNLAPPIRVAKCRRTGMLYLCPRPSRRNREALVAGLVPPALKDYGSATYQYGPVDKMRRGDFETRLKRLERGRRMGAGRILDIGTSSGEFMRVARARGWTPYGIEPSPTEAQLCREEGLAVEQGYAESLPFGDGSFDVVHASHVFEHLDDPLAAAREAWRVLRPSGVLMLEVPNQLDSFGFHRDNWFRAVRQRKRDITSIHHLWFFGRRTLADLFGRARFECVSVENVHHEVFGGWRFPISLTSRLLSDLFWGAGVIRGFGVKPA